MTKVYLEGMHIKKKTDVTPKEYKNDIHFSTRIESLSKNKVKGFMKTNIYSKHIETDIVGLEIEVIYSGVFESKTVTEEELNRWVEFQIVPQLLSFTRSTVANLTSEMDVQSILLPTMDLIQSLENNNDEANL